MVLLLVALILLLLIHTTCSLKTTSEDDCYILYVYTVNKLKCGTDKFPHYLRDTLKQALASQSHCKVALLANVGECPQIKHELFDKLDGNNMLSLIDTNSIPQSQMTKDFLSLAPKVLSSDSENGLWLLAATRFFHIFDWMTAANASNVFHIEGDTLLYRDFTPTTVTTIQQTFPTLAVTPSYINMAFLVAAVMWMSSVQQLTPFVSFVVDLVKDTNHVKSEYSQWLLDRFPHRDNAGHRIPNEMSMMAFFHYRYPDKLAILPVLPTLPIRHDNGIAASYHCHPVPDHLRCLYEQYSGRVGGVVSHDNMLGVFDGASWAQYLGGTHAYPGTPFKEEVSIIGNALNHDHCDVRFTCLTKAMMDRSFPPGRSSDHIHQLFRHNNNHTRSASTAANVVIAMNTTTVVAAAAAVEVAKEKKTTLKQCITAPIVRCNPDNNNPNESNNNSSNIEWSLLWNLHMHAKTTHLFRSRPCTCSTVIE